MKNIHRPSRFKLNRRRFQSSEALLLSIFFENTYINLKTFFFNHDNLVLSERFVFCALSCTLAKASITFSSSWFPFATFFFCALSLSLCANCYSLSFHFSRFYLISVCRLFTFTLYRCSCLLYVLCSLCFCDCHAYTLRPHFAQLQQIEKIKINLKNQHQNQK